MNDELVRTFFELQKRVLAHEGGLDPLMAMFAETCECLTGHDEFAFLMFDHGTDTVVTRFQHGPDPTDLEGLRQLVRSLAQSGQRSPRPHFFPPNADRPSVVVPLGSKAPFGAVVVPGNRQHDPATSFEWLEMQVMMTTAIERLQASSRLQLQMDEATTLYQVGKAISSTLDLTELLKKIMAMATKVMRCETSTVYLIDRETNELYFHIVQGDGAVAARLQEIRLPMGTGLAGWCAQNNQPVIVPDASKDPRFYKGGDKKSGFVTRSMICVPMRLKDEVVGVLQVLNRTGDIPFNEHDVELLEAVSNQSVSALDNARLYENIQKVYLATVEVLATAIDAKDPYTHGHSRRVTEYSVAIAEEMGFDPKQLEDIRYAGLLHDVGKIGIRDSIIGKPSKLTDEEYAIIKKHPEIGAQIIEPVTFMSSKIPGVLHHHEYYDGRGYPHHLVGEAIPLMARIICVADTFDAMTSDRPYRRGLDVNVAINELKKFSGRQFDPLCVEAFLKAYERRLFQNFEKEEGGDGIYLRRELREKREGLDAKAAAPAAGSGTESTQPFPPIHAEKPASQSSQPFPPIHPDKPPSESSQPFPPIHAEKPATESSQPYPPIHPTTGDGEKTPKTGPAAPTETKPTDGSEATPPAAPPAQPEPPKPPSKG